MNKPAPPQTADEKSPTHGQSDKTSGQTVSHHNETLATGAHVTSGGSASANHDPQNPHERDESSHSQARESQDQVHIGEQAYRDSVGPSTDTDRGPVLDAVYNGKIADGRGGPAKRR